MKITPEVVAGQAYRSINDVEESFRLHATSCDGRQISAPSVYAIPGEAMFRPFRAAKGSGEELQAELDRCIAADIKQGIDPGIECVDALRKALIQLGLGIDCSNFAYRVQTSLHERLGLEPIENTIVWDGGDVLRNYTNKPESWAPKDTQGGQRDLTQAELDMLHDGPVSVAWVAATFGKDLPFIISSRHLADPRANAEVAIEDTLPGDLVAFDNQRGNVSHVAVVHRQSTTSYGQMRVDLVHSWHTRGFDSGLRHDQLSYNQDSHRRRWSHGGLGDPRRYSGVRFLRPLAIQQALGAHMQIAEAV